MRLTPTFDVQIPMNRPNLHRPVNRQLDQKKLTAAAYNQMNENVDLFCFGGTSNVDVIN
jgi:hypothetical protein